jgi:hypothetical protein
MSQAVLIHDDMCGRAYVYMDGSLVLDVEKSHPNWQGAVADVLADALEAFESEGSVEQCDGPPGDLSGWSGLEYVDRDGEDTLRAIAGSTGSA